MTSRIRAFFTWWQNELLWFVPEPVRDLFRDNANLLYATRNDESIGVFRPKGQELEHVIDISLDPDTPFLLPRQIARKFKRGAAVTVTISNAGLLRRSIFFPAVAEEDLHQAALYEMERWTPFTRSDAYHAVIVRRRDPVASQLEADLYIVPKALVDNTVNRLASAGLRPIQVSVANDHGRPDERINFLGDTAPKRKLRFGAILAVFFGLTALGLAAALLSVPVIQKKDRVETVSQEIDSLRKEAREVARLRAEIARLADAHSAFERERESSIAITAVLDELTKRLPDNTWLNQLRVIRDRMSIFGFTDAAPRLIGIIESSPAFSNATIPTPVRPDPRTGKEQFHIEVHIDGAPAS